jgi:hypothetical protein
MSDDRHCFHIEGGAKRGGSTLTAWSSDQAEAFIEAQRHWHLGRGEWIADGQTGPDCEGNLYHHFWWKPVGGAPSARTPQGHR